MHQTFHRLAKYLTKSFSDHKMESEFIKTKDSLVVHDYKVTTIFLIMMSMTKVIFGLTSHTYVDLYISLGTILILIFIYIIQRFLIKCIHFLPSVALFAYNLVRLYLMHIHYDTSNKSLLFLAGYGYAAIQTIIITRIPKIHHKIMIILICFGFRFGIVIGVIDSKAADVFTTIRHILVDAFLMYVFYTGDGVERKVFQNFYENREELRKFKELLAESLPLSVTVVNCQTLDPLFSNNTFLDMFNSSKDETNQPFGTEEGHLGTSAHSNNGVDKPYLKSLQIDPSTIRAVGALHSQISPLDRSRNSMQLYDALSELVKKNALTEKALCVVASCTFQKQRRSFAVTLKRVKWDREDAIAIVLNDITYQESLIALKIANSNKDKIIATISHEFRTPLHGIVGMLQSIEKKIKDQTVTKYLNFCMDNAQLLLALVNSLLDLHQISTDKLRLSPAITNINKVLKDVTRLFLYHCHKKGLELKSVVSEDTPTEIYTDKNRLEQILVNLLGNAVKFTSHGSIKIEVNQDPEENKFLVISVSDTGIGIKKEEIANLFQMTGKLDETGSVNKNGVGLGLSITNALAILLSGKPSQRGVKVESKEGVGSTFSFRILKELAKVNTLQHDVENRGHQSIHGKGSRPTEQILDGHKFNLVFGETSSDDEITSTTHIKLIKEKYEEKSLINDYDESPLPFNISPMLTNYMSFQKMNSSNLRDLPSLRKLSTKEEYDPEQIKKASKLKSKTGTFMTESDENGQDRFRKLKTEEYKERILSANYEEKASHRELILVVDDNPFNLLVAENLIKSLGYEIKTAMGGQEAIDIVKTCNKEQELIKVIFMDCQMPVIDGYETTVILKSLMSTKQIQDIPILAWTANNSEEDVRRCSEVGMIGHLAKPTTKETLLKVLESLK